LLVRADRNKGEKKHHEFVLIQVIRVKPKAHKKGNGLPPRTTKKDPLKK